MADDAELKRRWAQAMLEPETPHVGEERWERLLGAGAADEERASAFEHVSECAECAATYRELRALREQARAFDTGVPAALTAPAARPFALRWETLGLAAGLALATLVGLRLLTPAPAPSPSAEDPLRSVGSAPRALEPLGRLARPPASFRWEGAAGLRVYRVELLSADGRALWTSAEVEALGVAWPAGLSLEPGRYYWRVAATQRQGAPASEALFSTLAQIEVVR